MFPAENVPPQETSQRRAERRAKRTIVDAECHRINCSPIRPVGKWNIVVSVNLLPCLDDAANEDGGTNIRACKLYGGESSRLANHVQSSPVLGENSRCTRLLT